MSGGAFDFLRKIRYNKMSNQGERSACLGMCVRNRLLALLLCGSMAAVSTGCGKTVALTEPIEPGSVPPVTVTSVTTAAETTTTTVTVNPLWAEQVSEKGKNGHIIENVPHYTQFNQYLTACESLAAVSVLRYYGIDMTPERFVDGFLPIADYPDTGEDGELHGESPWDYFIGDPMQANGFGCYSGALVRGINKLRDGLAVKLRYQSLDKLCTDYIDKGQPVIIWATMYMARPQDSIKWYLPNGRLFKFKAPEHALVLVGYDDKYYYFSDSLQYESVVAYGKEMTDNAYRGMLLQAVVIDPEVLETVPDFWAIPAEKDEAEEGAEAEESEDAPEEAEEAGAEEAEPEEDEPEEAEPEE